MCVVRQTYALSLTGKLPCQCLFKNEALHEPIIWALVVWPKTNVA